MNCADFEHGLSRLLAGENDAGERDAGLAALRAQAEA